MSAPLASSPDGAIVRVATPMDDFDIANLRLSVFSDFSFDQRGQFCARSCEAIANRRTKGLESMGQQSAAFTSSTGRNWVSDGRELLSCMSQK